MALNKVKHIALEVTMEDGQVLGAKMQVPESEYGFTEPRFHSSTDVITKVSARLCSAVTKAVVAHNDEHGNV